MDREKILDALKKALEDKGKRKFTQSVELAINFRDIDFNKQENRLNLEIVLPRGKGREQKVAVFADGQLAMDAKKLGVDVIGSDELPKLAADKAKLGSMLDFEFLAQPNLMAVVAKHLGQVLGTRGKLPKPLLGTKLGEAIERAKKVVKIKSKGKYLPVAHCLVGTENMGLEELAENIEAVLDAVKAKAGEQRIKSIYLKLTMGKPQKIGE
ncbi:MAG: 50S ribosomal protein L1 [Candidatus Micrarchaeota archaeon]|nr:50S ribosomal protein L1 [Candidatus Micrarchaeota archaeon]